MISLYGNELSGELPRELFEINSLVNIVLPGNKFRGLLPESICDFKNRNPCDPFGSPPVTEGCFEYLNIGNNKICPVHYQPSCFQSEVLWPYGIGSQNPDINDPDCPGIGVCAWNDQWGVHNGPVTNCNFDFSTQYGMNWVSLRAVCNEESGPNVYMCGNLNTNEENTNNCDVPGEWSHLTGTEACSSQGMTCYGVQILPGGC
jgi:hypothetical protein